ncbi:MAG: hypothetical protein ACPHP8_02465, partial [Luminiphilus sp.]
CPLGIRQLEIANGYTPHPAVEMIKTSPDNSTQGPRPTKWHEARHSDHQPDEQNDGPLQPEGFG